MAESMSKKMIIHITPSLHERIKKASEADDVSMSEFIRTSVEQRLDIKAASISVNLIDEVKESNREY